MILPQRAWLDFLGPCIAHSLFLFLVVVLVCKFDTPFRQAHYLPEDSRTTKPCSTVRQAVKSSSLLYMSPFWSTWTDLYILLRLTRGFSNFIRKGICK